MSAILTCRCGNARHVYCFSRPAILQLDLEMVDNAAFSCGFCSQYGISISSSAGKKSAVSRHSLHCVLPTLGRCRAIRGYPGLAVFA